MKQKRSIAFLQLVLYGQLILALLVLTAAGAKLYASALAARENHSHQRMALSYLQSQALGYTGEAIQVQPGPEGDMLVLREEGFETRIYVYDGRLCSEFSPADSEIAPQNGQSICPLERMQLEWVSQTLLHIQLDAMEGTICNRGGLTND